MSERMGIVELLRRIGEENIRVQNLADNFVRGSVKPSHAQVTFNTAPENMSDGVTGIVVWFPAEEGRRALRDAKAEGGSE